MLRQVLTCALVAVLLIVPHLFPLAVRVNTGDEKANPPQRFTGTSATDVLVWQQRQRKHLADALKLDGLPGQHAGKAESVPYAAQILSAAKMKQYTRYELEFNATAKRRMKAVLTVPTSGKSAVKFPAVVCIHGHGGDRFIVYDPKSVYRGFATELAERGYVTISVDVDRGGEQHFAAFEPGHTLMGERLGDLVRAVDYLTTRPEVDPQRIGVAGLSLGGEMAMWLGAMDPRIRATVSSGFLTTVANMRRGHCACWDFQGFSENFDFADIYGMITPRALLCQIGEQEGAPGGFPLTVAQEAMVHVRKVYAAFGKATAPILDAHPEGHVYVSKEPIRFLERELRP